MTERQRFVLRAALLYAQANLGDLNEAFSTDSDTDVGGTTSWEISVNGEIGPTLADEELDQAIMELQG